MSSEAEAIRLNYPLIYKTYCFSELITAEEIAENCRLAHLKGTEYLQKLEKLLQETGP